MMELREILGLPIKSSDKELTYNDTEIVAKSVRTYKVIDIYKNFEADEKVKEKDTEVYRIYEGIRKLQDKELWSDIQYSLIVLQSGKINGNLFRTNGYYRSFAENGYRYPEILQLAEGYVEILLQHPGDKHEIVRDVVVIRMQKYDVLVVPPSYGLVIINPSEKKAVLAKICATDAEENIEPFQRTKGGCYHRLEEGKWNYNKNYEEIPSLRLGEPQNRWKSLKRGVPIYAAYAYNPRIFSLLTKPDPLQFNI